MNKNRTIIVLALSILAMVVALGALVFFLKIIANKNKHTSIVLVTLANNIVKKEKRDVLLEKISEVELVKQTIDGHFVDPTKIDSFIDYLEKLGKDAGSEVKVENFEISTAEKNKLMVRLSAEGTFNNIMRTIMLLENTPYQIYITKTLIDKKPPQSDSSENKIGDKVSTSTPIWQVTISFNVTTL